MATATAELSAARKSKKATSEDAKDRYIAEIDRFASMLRIRQDEISRLSGICDEAKRVFENAKEAVRDQFIEERTAK